MVEVRVTANEAYGKQGNTTVHFFLDTSEEARKVEEILRSNGVRVEVVE